MKRAKILSTWHNNSPFFFLFYDFAYAIRPRAGVGKILSFTEERVVLETKHSGLGFRPYKHRYLLLNSLREFTQQCPAAGDRSIGY